MLWLFGAYVTAYLRTDNAWIAGAGAGGAARPSLATTPLYTPERVVEGWVDTRRGRALLSPASGEFSCAN